METQRSERARPVEQAVDKLRLQAWLARAEWRNPSLREDVRGLAQVRDELRLQVKLGKMEASREWDRLEKVWQKTKGALEATRGDIREDVSALLDDIRTGYDRLRG